MFPFNNSGVVLVYQIIRIIVITIDKVVINDIIDLQHDNRLTGG